MNISATFQKVLEFCTRRDSTEKKMDQNETPPPHDGMLRLENLSRNPSPLSPLQTTVTADTPSPASSRPPLRRSTTVDLEWNPAYRPLGGPEYLKILAKYNLFNEDERHGRVVCRFVNAGNLRDRQPQVIKVEEFSAQGNQEFLAHISIGNPPQSISPLFSFSFFCNESSC